MSKSNANIALDFARNTNASFFLTGRAGTGKSTLLRKIIAESIKNIVVLAPTGIAALNVNGMTIHSFFQLPPRTLLIGDKKIKPFWSNSEKRKLIESVDTIIIDEVSMVRADIMDAIDYSLRINSKNPNLPFGGKQMIFVGDLYQLEPITSDKKEKEYFQGIYGDSYFYNARVFEGFEYTTIELDQVYRQTDTDFVMLLDKIRLGSYEMEDLESLNSRVQNGLPNHVLTLTSHLKSSEQINKMQLSGLEGDKCSFDAEVSGTFESSSNPTDRKLNLKNGAQVMFIKNDRDKRWVNGTLGTIQNLRKGSSTIQVSLENGDVHDVQREVWNNVKYELNSSSNKVESKQIGSYKQFPLKLAWAITIHKSQGMTFNQLMIDFGSGAFASGQAYVALSRVRSLGGLFLKRAIRPQDILVNDFLSTAQIKPDQRDLLEICSVAKKEHKIFSNKGFIETGNIYLKRGLRFCIEKKWEEAYANLYQAYSSLPSDKYIIKNQEYKEIITKIKSMIVGDEHTKNSRCYFCIGIVQMHNKKYEDACSAFRSALKKNENALTRYFLSRILLLDGQTIPALDEIDRSLSIVPVSRSLYLKALIYNPYIEFERVEELLNKSLYIETLLLTLNADLRNISAYTDLLQFIAKEGVQVSLPSKAEYLTQMENLNISSNFVEGLKRLLQKNKHKLTSAALPFDQEEIPDSDSDNPISEGEELEYEISDEELGEDELDVEWDDY